MKKLLIILLLLFPTLALAQDKCCVIGSGKCVPLRVAADEDICGTLNGKLVNQSCSQVAQCKPPADAKCCIQVENQQCFSANTPAAVAHCKGQIINCACPPGCRPSCQP